MKSLLAGGLILVCAGATAAPIEYEISIESGADSLVGSITTDGTIGPITTAAIVGWSFTSEGTAAFSMSSSSAGAAFQCIPVSGCFSASEAFLTYAFSSPTPNDPFVNFQSDLGTITFLDVGNSPPAGRISVCTPGPSPVCIDYTSPPDKLGSSLAPLDVDGDGATEALTDGLLTLRYHFGFTGAALITGAVGAECARCTAPEILAYLQSLD